ncbi:MAG TPA: thioredoxin family protein [Paracoccus sp. (in: a-proteobacteria)]|uniref:thioredoxin family protein n=1 Tax=uncultured Paracoccus sp. TaxID=189685 RepID=UPI00261B501D|nr:thioredoxin family protein [uncultured Paracoccus sp.]HMQ40272.1 thioredoxin family protein [Paracoccus sp. (in: a-proteobacteria)]HMR35242.1 thioredoxin family protein [Paracoccus sp. (in: a-proteobacteria)]
MAVTTPVCDYDAAMPDFALPDPDGRIFRRDDLRGPRGTLVIFICNHCPYVQAVLDRIARDAAELQRDHGIGVVAISANDIADYPQDAPEFMKAEAEKHGFSFPYLYDESQSVARAYGAECTPDFFGYNAEGKLQYRGRLDASGRQPGPPDAKRELFEAMILIARTGQGPRDQTASMGCSIKWKA